jgi:hypothetical protein
VEEGPTPKSGLALNPKRLTYTKELDDDDDDYVGVIVPVTPDPSVASDDTLTDSLSGSDEEDGEDPTVMFHPNLEERLGEDQVEGDSSFSNESSSDENGEKRAFSAIFAHNKENSTFETGQKLPLTDRRSDTLKLDKLLQINPSQIIIKKLFLF